MRPPVWDSSLDDLSAVPPSPLRAAAGTAVAQRDMERRVVSGADMLERCNDEPVAEIETRPSPHPTELGVPLPGAQIIGEMRQTGIDDLGRELRKT